MKNILIIFFTPVLIFTQTNQDTTNNIIPISSSIPYEETSQTYRPGLNFQSSGINPQNSRQNIINSSSVSIEPSNVGRSGAIRIDGATTPPILGIDGFMIKDPSINQGQFILDLLPYDFADRVDIYKQNMVPFGLNAGSFIDFRIPITHQKYTKIQANTSTLGSIYTKIQSEQTFKDGSTFFGILGDLGLADYYYATHQGKDFEIYPNSTYTRTSFISKTVWKNLEFLLANTFTDSFTETGTPADKNTASRINRNNLISGIKYHHNIFILNANYTFYNQLLKNANYTNDYLNHQLNIQTGVTDHMDRYFYRVLVGYEFNQLEDGARASRTNYNGIPKYGDHFAHIITEFGVSAFKEETNPVFNIDFTLALNQIISKNMYIPVPNLTIGFRHRNGMYASVNVSRVFVLPDFSTAYGFGTTAPLIEPKVKPKDGVRSGIEIGINKASGRFFTAFTYSWLDRGFRLTEANTVVNSDDITSISAEIGGEYKYIIQNNIIQFYTGLSWTKETDKKEISPTPIPEWKWMSQLLVKDIDNTWKTALTYKLVSHVPNGSGLIDTTPRHYLDLNIKYKAFIFNILNLANQSYRPIPYNKYSPYNPGIRAEIGIEYQF